MHVSIFGYLFPNESHAINKENCTIHSFLYEIEDSCFSVLHEVDKIKPRIKIEQKMIREFSIIDYFRLVISTYQNEPFRCC